MIIIPEGGWNGQSKHITELNKDQYARCTQSCCSETEIITCLVQHNGAISPKTLLLLNKLLQFCCVHVTVDRNKFIFNKNNRRTIFSKFIFVKKFYMFRGSPPAHHQEFSTVNSALVYVLQVWWHTPEPNVQWRTPDDVEFLDKNKFGKISASVGFIKNAFTYIYLVYDILYFTNNLYRSTKLKTSIERSWTFSQIDAYKLLVSWSFKTQQKLSSPLQFLQF